MVHDSSRGMHFPHVHEPSKELVLVGKPIEPREHRHHHHHRDTQPPNTNVVDSDPLAFYMSFLGIAAIVVTCGVVLLYFVNRFYPNYGTNKKKTNDNDDPFDTYSGGGGGYNNNIGSYGGQLSLFMGQQQQQQQQSPNGFYDQSGGGGHPLYANHHHQPPAPAVQPSYPPYPAHQQHQTQHQHQALRQRGVGSNTSNTGDAMVGMW